MLHNAWLANRTVRPPHQGPVPIALNETAVLLSVRMQGGYKVVHLYIAVGRSLTYAGLCPRMAEIDMELENSATHGPRFWEYGYLRNVAPTMWGRKTNGIYASLDRIELKGPDWTTVLREVKLGWSLPDWHQFDNRPDWAMAELIMDTEVALDPTHDHNVIDIQIVTAGFRDGKRVANRFAAPAFNFWRKSCGEHAQVFVYPSAERWADYDKDLLDNRAALASIDEVRFFFMFQLIISRCDALKD